MELNVLLMVSCFQHGVVSSMLFFPNLKRSNGSVSHELLTNYRLMVELLKAKVNWQMSTTDVLKTKNSKAAYSVHDNFNSGIP